MFLFLFHYYFLYWQKKNIYSFYFFTIFKVDTAHKCFTQEKLPELYLQFITLIWEQGVGGKRGGRQGNQDNKSRRR